MCSICAYAYAPCLSSRTQTCSVPGITTFDSLTSLLSDLQKDVVQQIAQKLGKTPTQVLLRWGLQHGSSVIPKSGDQDHQKVGTTRSVVVC